MQKLVNIYLENIWHGVLVEYDQRQNNSYCIKENGVYHNVSRAESTREVLVITGVYSGY